MNKRQTWFFDSRDMMPTVVKFGWPSIFLFVIIMSLREPSVTRAWKGFLVLIALAAIFLLRCALIELDSDGVRYKRFTRWHKISYSDITQCGFSVVPGVGYLRLRNKKFPFRRLFFVFYHPYVSSWRSYSANRKIIEEIQGKISSTKPSEHMPSELEKGQEDPDSTEIEKTWPQLGRCALAIILGFSFILFVRLYLGLPGQGFPPPVSDNSSPAWHFIVAWWKIGVRILGWPYNLIVVIGLLGGLAIFFRRRGGWAWAAVLGAFLGDLFARIHGS